MNDAAVARVRSFNRLVTERVGALNDEYLARDRSLGQCRLLWEIGVDGRDVRELRARLGLDSGYVSRLLRTLERAGLVEVVAREDDRRVRAARLTPAGRVEVQLLDRRSDEFAHSFLQPLGEHGQARLVQAMGEGGRLVAGAPGGGGGVDPGRPGAPARGRCLFGGPGGRL